MLTNSGPALATEALGKLASARTISSPCPILARTDSNSGERIRGMFLSTTILPFFLSTTFKFLHSTSKAAEVSSKAAVCCLVISSCAAEVVSLLLNRFTRGRLPKTFDNVKSYRKERKAYFRLATCGYMRYEKMYNTIVLCSNLFKN